MGQPDDDEEMEKIGKVVLEAVAQQAEPILNAKLRELGVSTPGELPPDLRKKVFLDAMRTAAPLAVPGTDVDKFLRILESLSDPEFARATSDYQLSAEPTDALAPAVGLDAALVMAGIGLPVAPFDQRLGTLAAPYSSDLATVRKNFENHGLSIVCYNSAEAEFYSLQTDCIKTLRSKIAHDDRALAIRKLVKRSHVRLPDAKERFTHFATLFARKPGDRISSVMMLDDREDKGSILLSAGWIDPDGSLQGAPRDGRAMVPVGLVRKVSLDGRLAYWLTEPHDKPPITYQ